MSLTDVIIEENGLLLNEAAIGIDRKRRIAVGVSLDAGRGLGGKYAYFKVARYGHFTNEKELCRLSFREPSYIDHNNDIPDKWWLNAKDKKILMSILTTPYKHDKTITVWQALINEFNSCVMSGGESNRKYLIDINLPITDYTNLPERR